MKMEDNMNAAVGITDILIDALNKKYDNVRDLNSLNVNLSEENFEAMIPVIDSIIEDENNHIGKLQQLIDLLSNSEDDIEEGKQETIEIIDTSDEFVESITSMKKKLILSENFDNVIDDVQAVADPVFVGANEEHDENKKKYEDAMEENKKAAEDTIPDEGDTGKDIKSKELKAMHLSESLFEDVEGLNWQYWYSLFDMIVNEYLPDTDLVNSKVESLYNIFSFNSGMEEAYRRWCDTENLEESCDQEKLKEELDFTETSNLADSLINYLSSTWEDLSEYEIKQVLKYCIKVLGDLDESCDKKNLEESIQCAIAKEQIKRFNEGKMPKNWNVDSYLNKLTEKKHITKKEAKSLREWYSTIK